MSQALLADIPGIEIMPPLDDSTPDVQLPESYATAYARGCLHWHTPNGDHYADVLQTNRLMAGGPDDRPEDPNCIRGGQLIQPMPQPAQLFGVQHEMVPRANVVPDRDMTMVALIEFHDCAYWCSLWWDLHRVLTGQQQTAPLAPLTEDEFRRLF